MSDRNACTKCVHSRSLLIPTPHVAPIPPLTTPQFVGTTAGVTRVNESAPIGTKLGHIEAAAVGGVPMSELEHTIVDPDLSPFTVGRKDGVLVVSGELDYETKTSRTIVIRSCKTAPVGNGQIR